MNGIEHLCLLALLYVVGIESIGSLVNVEVDRSFDLDRHLPFIRVRCVVENQGDLPVDTYQVAIDPFHAEKVSYVLGGVDKADMVKLHLVDDRADKHKTGGLYALKLVQPLAPQRKLTLYLEYVLFDALVLLPASIRQTDPQFVRFHFSPIFYSPYPTASQTTLLLLGTENVLGYSKDVRPISDTKTGLKYGPFKDTKETFKAVGSWVHYENNQRFIRVNSLKREVKVSNWGKISVEDRIELEHTGARLEQGFSRFDYMQMLPKPTTVPSFVTTLPRSAENIFYRDDLGNISTSSISHSANRAILLELTPRYPLFGGWKTAYNVGYNMEAFRYLRYHPNRKRYSAKVRLIDHIMTDMEIERLRLRIVLPELARDITIDGPFPIEGYNCTYLTHAYLDTIGRSTCIMEMSKLTNWHSQHLTVEYTLDTFHLWRKPLYASVVILILFFTAILLVRVDLSVVKDPCQEQRMKLAAQWEKLVSHMSSIEWLHGNIKSAIKRFNNDRNFADMENSRKKFEMEFKRLTENIADSTTDLINESKVYSSRVSLFTTNGVKIRDLLRSLTQTAQKFASGKVSKSTYSQQEEQFLNSVERLVAGIVEQF